MENVIGFFAMLALALMLYFVGLWAIRDAERRDREQRDAYEHDRALFRRGKMSVFDFFTKWINQHDRLNND